MCDAPEPGHAVTLYSRPGCHLCDVAKGRLDEVRARVPFSLEIVDISTDPSLASRFGDRIPVLLLDGEELFAYRVNPEVLERKLSVRRPPARARLRDWLSGLRS